MRLKLFLLYLVFVSFSNVNAQTAINIKNAWGDIDNDLSPWVYNSSRPNKIKRDLKGDIYLCGLATENILIQKKVYGV